MAADTTAQDFYVRFWGVRGSIAVGSPEVMRYGGNTSCLEIRCGERLLIFDAGTGLRALGNQLRDKGPQDADLFITHTHLDHICGLPFFCPLFDPRNRFRIRAGHLTGAGGIREALSNMMTPPLFPVPLEIFLAQIEYGDFPQGDALDLGGGITVRTVQLAHPDNATGYRVDFGGRSICYLTDTEHPPEIISPALASFVSNADLLVYDSMYTPEQYASRRGWGHSTWQAGTALSDAAGVRTFVAFHHDPEHDDAFMDQIAADLSASRPGSVVAREGMTLRP